jgi:transcription termination/antitermination protein NusG
LAATMQSARGRRRSGGERRDEEIMSKRWYIVHAYSNFERKVAEDIKKRALAAGLSDLFEEVLVPTEEIVEVRRGRKVSSERKFFPGYVLVKMQMTDPAYHLIKNTPKVTGFLGADNKAIPISEAEAMRILHQVKEGVERPKPMVTFEIGEKVRVADGPFATFEGHVEEVDEQRARLKVGVSIFGRPTPVELEFGQVEKVA